MHSNLQENSTYRPICKVAENNLKFYLWYAVKPVFSGLLKEKYTQGKLQLWESFKDARFIKRSKLKCTIVQALRLCTGRTAHRGVEV